MSDYFDYVGPRMPAPGPNCGNRFDMLEDVAAWVESVNVKGGSFRIRADDLTYQITLVKPREEKP